MVETRNSEYWKREILLYDNDVLKALKISENRIELSEKILNGIRDFCESVACFIFKISYPDKKYESRYDEIKTSLSFCKSNSSLNFI